MHLSEGKRPEVAKRNWSLVDNWNRPASPGSKMNSGLRPAYIPMEACEEEALPMEALPRPIPIPPILGAMNILLLCTQHSNLLFC